MSVVLVIATQDSIFFMSDGRVQGETRGVKSILQEDYKKLNRINQNICIGYTGNKYLCEQTIKAMNDPYKPIANLNLDNIQKFLCAEARSVYLENNYLGIKMAFIVGGVTTDGKIEFYTFGSMNDFIIQKYSSINGDINYAGLYPENAKGNELEKHLLANVPLNEDKIKKAMIDCIDEIAALDSSVNRNKFIEVIRR